MASNLKICGPCERGGDQKDVVYWCSTCRDGLCKNCSKEHKKNRASTNHKIVQFEHISNVSASVLSVNTFCEEHAGKEISFYCPSHSKLCCVACIPTFHRNCEDVITIEDASKSSAQSGEVDDLQTRIEDLSGIFGVILKKQDENINTLELQESKYEKEIEERKKIIALALERAEKTEREHLRNQKKMCVHDIMAKRTQIVKNKTHLETMQRDLNTLKEHASDEHIFITVKRLDAVQVELEHEMQNQRKTLIQYELNTSATKTPLPKFDSLLVGVKIKKKSMDDVPQLKKYTQCQIVSRSAGKLTLKKEINIEEKTGQRCDGIYKVCYFPVHDKVAVTNTSSHSVYIYDMPSGHVQIVKLKEEGALWYITTFDDNNALVTVQGQKRLFKLNITDLTVKTEASFKKDVGCLCLVTCVNNHIVTWEYGTGEFCVIKNGQVLRKIPEQCDVGYMCGYDKDKIIYTCYYDCSVICVNLSGHVVFSLTADDLSPNISNGPLGVVVDRDNYIYVASQRGIVRLTPSGKNDKSFDSSVGALGLAYKKSTHELITVNCQWLRVFKIE